MVVPAFRIDHQGDYRRHQGDSGQSETAAKEFGRQSRPECHEVTPERADNWLRVAARAAVTASCLSVGLWLVFTQQTDWGYSFLTFVAGYWLK